MPKAAPPPPGAHAPAAGVHPAQAPRPDLLALAAALEPEAQHLLDQLVAPLGRLAAVGLLTGYTNHKRLSLVLPPLFSAVAAPFGAAILWSSHARGAALPWLALRPLAVTMAVLAFGLLVLSFEREHRARLPPRGPHQGDGRRRAEAEARSAPRLPRQAVDQRQAKMQVLKLSALDELLEVSRRKLHIQQLAANEGLAPSMTSRPFRYS